MNWRRWRKERRRERYGVIGRRIAGRWVMLIRDNGKETEKMKRWVVRGMRRKKKRKEIMKED